MNLSYSFGIMNSISFLKRNISSEWIYCNSIFKNSQIKKFYEIVQYGTGYGFIYNAFIKNKVLQINKKKLKSYTLYFFYILTLFSPQFGPCSELEKNYCTIWSNLTQTGLKINSFMYFNTNLYYRIQNRFLLSQYKHANN